MYVLSSLDIKYHKHCILTIREVSTGEADRRMRPLGSQARQVTGAWFCCCNTWQELVDGLKGNKIISIDIPGIYIYGITHLVC